MSASGRLGKFLVVSNLNSAEGLVALESANVSVAVVVGTRGDTASDLEQRGALIVRYDQRGGRQGALLGRAPRVDRIGHLEEIVLVLSATVRHRKILQKGALGVVSAVVVVSARIIDKVAEYLHNFTGFACSNRKRRVLSSTLDVRSKSRCGVEQPG